jgi:TatD DNase family protein
MSEEEPNIEEKRNVIVGAHPEDCSCGEEYCYSSQRDLLSSSRNLNKVLKSAPRFLSCALSCPLFDSHCHLNLSRLFEISAEVVQQCLSENVQWMSVCGVLPGEDWLRVQQLSVDYPSVVIPNYGIHPWYIEKYEGDNHKGPENGWIEQLEWLLQENPLAGVGECGLHKDLKKKEITEEEETSSSRFITMDKQIQYLRHHIRLACKYHRPLSIHCVTGCWSALFATLKEQLDSLSQDNQCCKSIILHSCHSMSVDTFKQFQKYFNNNENNSDGNRLFYSFAATAFSQKSALKLLKEIPLDYILLESDSPDQLPREFYDQNIQFNTPLIVKYSCFELCKLLNLDNPNVIAETSVRNAKKAFGVCS